jgi:hypothetical protein
MRYGAISLADSGAITFQTNGSITAQGTSGLLTLTSGSGGTASAGGTLTLQSGAGGSTSGAGGALQLFAGAAAGTTGGAGGAVSLTAGDAAGSTGGAGGAVSLTAGAGAGTNQAGGAVALTGGLGTGTGAPGGVTLTAANSATGVGANVVLTAGAGSVLANDGVVQISRVPTSNRATRLRFVGDNAGTLDLKAPAAVTSYAMTWPGAVAAVANTPLQSSVAGVLSWSTSGTTRQTLFTETAADTTTTSATFVTLLTQAITIVAGNNVMVWFSAGCSNSNNNAQVNFRLTIDAVAVRGVGSVAASGATNASSVSLVYLSSGLAAGVHTFAIQWLVSANTGRIRPVTVPSREHASLIIQEVSP